MLEGIAAVRVSRAAFAAVLLCATSNAPARPGEALPSGPGQSIAQTLCAACHRTSHITRSLGYTEDGWRELIATMLDPASIPDVGTLTGYLAEHFPPGAGPRPATLVAGPVRISFREWVTPTRGQRSRDPVQAPDGSIWWAGQWGNLVGRIDAATGRMREYPLPEGARPHTVTPDAEGNIWYTGNKNGTLGKLEPATGKVVEYPMPDPAARDPHTLVFDARGRAYFTLQHSNMVGRLVPATGEIDLVTLPTPGAKPYGIVVNGRGVLFVACNGSNCIYRIDPDTLAARRFELPHEDTHVRRLDLQDDGTVWYVNSGRGRIGRLDVATGEVREWPTPSGPKSHPYAIAVRDGIVWFNESGVRPDPLVRFDPKSETFQSWPIPSGNLYAGIIRHMRWTDAGTLLIHQSSTRRILEVTIGP